jgi:hypothetical protein
MSAISGLAMESSAKGVSLSTTTARFIATFRDLAVPAVTTRTSLAMAAGSCVRLAASASRAARTTRSNVMRPASRSRMKAGLAPAFVQPWGSDAV